MPVLTARTPGFYLKLLKLVAFAASLVPAALLVRGLLTGNLGPNPAEAVQLGTGIWSLRFLVATLLITPLRRLTGLNRLIQYRRMLGNFAFFYGLLHLLSYVAFDLVFAWNRLPQEVAKRPFIAAGMVAFAAMVPLAVTSTRGWIRRLGKRWTMLHRLIYLSGIAAVVHYLWKVKVIAGPPVYYAILLGILLGLRVYWALRKRRHAARPLTR